MGMISPLNESTICERNAPTFSFGLMIPSARPSRLPEYPDYPSRFTVRMVNESKAISFKNSPFFIGKVLGGEFIGIEAIAEGCWTVWFGPILLGSIFDRGKREFEFLGHKPSSLRKVPR